MLTMDIKINSSLPSPLRDEKSFLKGLFIFTDIRKLQDKAKTSLWDLGCRLTFRQKMNIINVSGDLPGFIVWLTSLTSKHTSFGR